MTLERFPSGDILSPSDISQLGRHGYVVGKKIANSWAPFIHDIVFRGLDLPWGQVRLELDDMGEFMKLVHHPEFFGAAITMPNKVAILPYLDEMTDECRDIGACNTVYFRQDQGRQILCGANTDAVGIRDAFYRNINPSERTFHNRPALVIGGGGAARSAVYALRKWMNVTTIYLVNRDKSEVNTLLEDFSNRGYGHDLLHVETVSQALDLHAPGAIISCIPDFEPQATEEIAVRRIIERFLSMEAKGFVLEMCYNPTPFTKLASIVKQKGWSLILGTEALIWQGLEQDRLWTGRSIDEHLVQQVQAGISQKVAQREAKTDRNEST
ncbi:hypothetical protein N7541_000800 [Penicillium brevicompactum]|uniref:Shikimate dehydrogenase substrate binding N-terminal domain-containing protein n=1 Tax=Penicillium brevicompactum TaxID=5074 RepID=A0A9W9RXG4_PENBR|nr:hypothetical protein N7541_000800 [Penicillium brevicompactum]